MRVPSPATVVLVLIAACEVGGPASRTPPRDPPGEGGSGGSAGVGGGGGGVGGGGEAGSGGHGGGKSAQRRKAEADCAAYCDLASGCYDDFEVEHCPDSCLQSYPSTPDCLACAAGATGCREMEACLAGCEQRTCEFDVDCGEGYVCRPPRCEWDPECVRDRECGEGYRCASFHCAEIECRSSEDCGAREVCYSGACYRSNHCGSDEDCDVGTVCVDGECTTRFGCDRDRDCEPPNVCRDHVCERIPCSSDGNCPAGSVCAREHVCIIPSCTDERPCRHELARCDHGVCRLPDCRSDAECLGNPCIDDFCEPIECIEDRECPPQLVCQRPHCRIPFSCVNGEACFDSFTCYRGSCAPECGDGVGCRQSEVCLEGACVGQECSVAADCVPNLGCLRGYCL